MNYNFTSISVDSLANFEKKIRKIKENILDDINNFVRVLNNEAVIKRQSEINTVINDLIEDHIKKSVISFTECMVKVQKTLAQNL